MNCFMFPGQPLAFGSPLPDDEDFAAIARLTREHAFLDLGTLSWTRGAPTENVKLQVYGVAMSLYHCRRLRRQGGAPDLVAEHSMGIYPALAACGFLTEAEVLELTFRAGMCMATLGGRQKFALGCVIGMPLGELLVVAENHNVYLANHNTSRHFLLSGAGEKMADAMAEALSAGAFSAKLFPCDAPLHTPLMAELEAPLREIFGGFSYRDPGVRLMNHIDQDFLTASEISDFLFAELCEPVYWERTYRALHGAGVTRFHEVGAGDSLKKYNRWIDYEKFNV